MDTVPSCEEVVAEADDVEDATAAAWTDGRTAASQPHFCTEFRANETRTTLRFEGTTREAVAAPLDLDAEETPPTTASTPPLLF